MNSANAKQVVREHYGEIARQSRPASAGCGCGSSGGCCDPGEDALSREYAKLDGYVAEADLGLGCGIPVDIAGIAEGNTVVDLGSGAGNDVFVARRLVGEQGKVIGIDMTEAMIERANRNKEKLGYANVEFRLGEIEAMPVATGTADVVLSNCVLNLVPGKAAAFAEVFRILKPGGHFSISDIVLVGKLPAALEASAVLYAGCVAGAIQKEEYLDIIRQTGFTEVVIRRETESRLPDEVLNEYLSSAERDAFKSSGAGILSITVTGVKPESGSAR